VFNGLRGTVKICRKQLQAISSMVGSSSVQLAQFPNMIKEFGALKSFVHTPSIDPSVRPVHQKFWHSAISLRDEIPAELRWMESDGITERVKSSACASNGGARLCVNLKDVNKVLTPER